MTVFADSSALVKLYVAEAHHEAIRAIAEPIIISALAEVEVPAALWRKHRIGEISGADAGILSAEFAADVDGEGLAMPRFAVVAVGSAVVAGATGLVARHPLRGFDAVQLATALAARQTLGRLGRFVAFDVVLRSAAAAEGLALVPETFADDPIGRR